MLFFDPLDYSCPVTDLTRRADGLAPASNQPSLLRALRLSLVTLVLAALSACGGGGGGGGSSPPPSSVTVSGRVTFERVPFSGSSGLSYNSTVTSPAREVVVQLVSSAGTVLATTSTDSDGRYSFSSAPNTSVFVRARAESQKGSPGWQIGIYNNTNSNALYVLDTAQFSTGTANVTKNLLATTGWTGSSYGGVRAAAPFAILDTLLSAVQFVRTNGSASVDLPDLQVFWSTLNVADPHGVNWDPANGQILSTQYLNSSLDGWPPGIYLVGLADDDTDEFDQHVIAHEFNHFLEDVISRSDSFGGSHGPDEQHDMRLAFSEGFATAFSAMVLGDPVYKDSLGTRQAALFSMNLDANTNTPDGWYNEASVQSLVWDLYDASADGGDNVNLGYAPMFSVMTSELRTGSALTSIYPFISGLKTRSSSTVAANITSLTQSRLIFGTDAFGAGETNNGTVPTALPIYTNVALNGGQQRVCGTAQLGTFNWLGNSVFLKFSLNAAQAVTFRAEYTDTGSTPPLSPTADPDFILYKGGIFAVSESVQENVETMNMNLDAGEYVLEVYEWSHIVPDPTSRGVTCMNVSITG